MAGYLRSASHNDAVVLIAMIATFVAIQIYVDLPISTIGNVKSCSSHKFLLSSFPKVLIVFKPKVYF